MSLWLYYACHSFVNQIKKLFRTWVAIFLAVCIGLGVILGIGAVLIGNLVEEHRDPAQSEEIPAQEAEEDTDILGTEFLDKQTGEVVATLDAETLMDLVCGGIGLIILLIMLLTADNTNIFLPADTVMLFTAPMKPQKVLMFRLSSTIGAYFALFLYFLILSPSYVSAFDLSFGVIVSIIFAYIMVILETLLLKMIAYMYCAGDKKKKNVVNGVAYAILGLAVAGCALYLSRARNDALAGNIINYLTHGVSRWIPVVGWLKSVVLYAYEGNVPMTLLFVGLNLLTVVVSLLVLFRMKADFYEPALAKSEEFANRQAAMLEQRSATKNLSKRATDKREKIKKEGIGRGKGASVLFWKEMYNRFLFAKFGIFTKTFDIYAVFSIALVALFAYNGMRTMLPGALLIATLDFYSSTVCTFIGLVVPQNLANGLKSVILIMFIYFGIAPAAVSIVLGIVFGHTAVGALIAAAFNAGVGAIFFSFLPLFY